MKNRNDSDWTFTVRMHKIAAHSRISRGLFYVLLVLHCWACLLSTDGTYQSLHVSCRLFEKARITEKHHRVLPRTRLQIFLHVVTENQLHAGICAVAVHTCGTQLALPSELGAIRPRWQLPACS